MAARLETAYQSDNIPCIRLSINSDLSNIHLIAIAVRSLAAELRFKEASPSGIELALVELLTNCITHSTCTLPNQELIVEYKLLETELSIRTIDNGDHISEETQNRINDSDIAMQDLPTDVMMLPESGWGLSLIKSLSQSLSYERVGNKNLFTLTFALN